MASNLEHDEYDDAEPDLLEDVLRRVGIVPADARLTERGRLVIPAALVVIVLVLLLMLRGLFGGGDAEPVPTPTPTAVSQVADAEGAAAA